jgi:hypothetical protein
MPYPFLVPFPCDPKRVSQLILSARNASKAFFLKVGAR